MDGKNGMICLSKKITIDRVLDAARSGCGTAEELLRDSGACGACSGCKAWILNWFTPVCDCLGVYVSDIAQVWDEGAHSLDAIFEASGAGAVCGRCKNRVEKLFNILINSDKR